jgi:hypothetical protein
MMDERRWDRWSKALATVTTRRRALRGVGAAGLATTSGLLLNQPVLAQDDDVAPPAQPADEDEEPSDICVLDFRSTVRIGRSAEDDAARETRGQLTVPIFGQGGLNSATLLLDDGTEYSVVGHTSGRAVQLRVQIAPGQAIVVVGAGEESLRACRGLYSGPSTGPLPGDLGDWRAVPVE